MPSPRNLHLSPRKDNYTTPRRAQGRSPHRRHADVDVVSPRGRGFRMTPRPELASPGAGSYRHARSPGRGAYSAGELGSPGGRVVDVQRYTREVPRTIYDQEAYDVVTVEEPIETTEIQRQIETRERTEWRTEIETHERTEWETVEEPVVVIKTRMVPRLVTEWVEEEYEDIEYETYDRPYTVVEDVPVDVPVKVLEDVEVDVAVPVTEWVQRQKRVPVVDGSPVFEDLSPRHRPYRPSPRQRKLDYGSPGSVRSRRDRERGWNI